MAVSAHAQKLLKQAGSLLPVSDEDLIYKGIATSVSERMMELSKKLMRLRAKYGSLETLEERIQSEGVSPDDHTRYTDLLEWRAIDHERRELLHLLEDL